jgi:hypothetical protein
VTAGSPRPGRPSGHQATSTGHQTSRKIDLTAAAIGVFALAIAVIGLLAPGAMKEPGPILTPHHNQTITVAGGPTNTGRAPQARDSEAVS